MTKSPGRRARVTKLTREEVQQTYQVRASLEGLAARLTVERQADLTAMVEALEDLHQAYESNDLDRLVNADEEFHLGFCESSGNPILLAHARRLMVPLFAFVLIRVRTNQQGIKPWHDTLKLHDRIIQVLRLGDPLVAEQFVTRATIAFGLPAYDDWEAHPTKKATSSHRRV